jgi:hypothetical protein
MMKNRWIVCAVLCLAPAVAGCPRGADSSAKPDAGGEGPGLGDVMAQVGRRFEIAGRAAVANRFELAEFEAGELEELFEGDVPRASLPKEGPTAHIAPMARAFLENSAPDLKKAAAAKNRDGFTAAFQRTATACNACHQSSQKAFIQVPAVPGKAVPDLDPL